MTTARPTADQAIMIPAWVDGVLQPVEKLETHRRGLKHKAVSVFIVRDGQLLIQQRAAGKYHTPGLWANTCCTHPEWNETAIHCATRRLEEELGITGIHLHPRETIEYRAPVGQDLIEHEIAEVFLGEAGPDLVIDPAPEEVQAVRWVDLADFGRQIEERPDQFTPWIRIYMRDHHGRIFGEAD